MATIKPSEIELTHFAANAPSAHVENEPYIEFGGTAAGAFMNVEPRGTVATAKFFLHGSADENVSGWRFGFIQLLIALEDWVAYRGATRADGSSLIARDRPPVRAEEVLCLDSNLKASPPWYAPEQTGNPQSEDIITKVLPEGTTISRDGKLKIVVRFSDVPRFGVYLAEDNSSFTPSRKNLLYRVQRNLKFTTVVAAQFTPKGKKPGDIQLLAHFNWASSVNVELDWKVNNPPGVGNSLKMIKTLIEPGFKLGPPVDPDFKNRTLDKTLPIALTLIAKSWQDKRANRHYNDWFVADFEYGVQDPLPPKMTPTK